MSPLRGRSRRRPTLDMCIRSLLGDATGIGPKGKPTPVHTARPFFLFVGPPLLCVINLRFSGSRFWSVSSGRFILLVVLLVFTERVRLCLPSHQSGRAVPAAFLRPQHRRPGSAMGHLERLPRRHTRLRRQDRNRHRGAANSYAGECCCFVVVK